MRISAMALLLIPVALGGCMYAYKPPTDGPVANLRVVARGTSGFTYRVGVYTFDDAKCGGTKKLGQLGQIGTPDDVKEIGMPTLRPAKPGEFTEAQIRAASPFYLGLALGKQWAGVCYLTVTFTPEPGHHYEAVVDTISNECSVDAYELVPSSDGSISQAPIASLAKNDTTCTSFVY